MSALLSMAAHCDAAPARAPLVSAGSSVADGRRQLTQAFRACGLDTPELDARILVGHALGLDHAALAARSAELLTAADADRIVDVAGRRLRREPVARIVGRKEFWGLPLRLDASTLVPRPQSETVVEAALEAVDRGGARSRPLHVADLGTGSGALILALLSELPAARGVATDVSAAALGCARANAEALGLGARVHFVACDYAAALKGPFDLVVANPPYVAHDQIAILDPEVRDFDPRAALDGGADGLNGYRAIAEQLPSLLAPSGQLVLELGLGQRDAVAEIMIAAGLRVADARRDLAGVERALVVKRS
jgi:release factor glutamine methyltransferase